MKFAIWESFSFKVPMNLKKKWVFSMNMLALLLCKLVCSKTMTQFAFRRYKLSIKARWILIGCQCFYPSSAGKKVLKVIPTIPFYVIIITLI